VKVSGDVVTIRNPVHTTKVACEEIALFEVGPHGLYPKVAVARLRDGRDIRIFGIQGPNPVSRPGNRDAETLVARLNERLAAGRASGDSDWLAA
jgi:hypothetical protein